MVDTPDTTTCPDTSAGREDSLSPFRALNYHFGMLLGVDDFATEQQYHHGKMRLHNAWLHRAGVVWGFDVRLDLEHGEVRVLPGLALDASGHELHLDGDACVNVVEWFLAHKDEEGFATAATETGFSFDAHVEIRFKACLTRQVPALLEPCEGGAGGTAYSRVFETVDIRLLPGKAPAPEAQPYHRLRVLFGLEAPNLPTDQAVVDARLAVLALPSDEQPTAYLDAVRKFAAFDEIDLQPAKSSDDSTRLLFPAPGDFPVVLADITGITLDRGGDNSLKVTGGTVDVTVRPSHVATATIQELLCGPLFTSVGESSPVSGPRVLPTTVQITDNDISFDLDKPLHAKSVTIDAFSVTTFTDAEGWKNVAFTVDGPSNPATSVKLDLTTPLEQGMLVRFIAKGSGPKPLLGTSFVPLAGRAVGPEPSPHDGFDFVFMQVRS